jgi:hypothetical protein
MQLFLRSTISASWLAALWKMTMPARFASQESSGLSKSAATGINDLSTVTLDTVTGLPRFNMPLELGLFLGCKRFGARNQSNKRILILDSEQYRYRQFISDISGQDIRAHGGDPARAIRAVRDWLQATSKRRGLAGGGEIVEHYRRFHAALPTTCREAELEPDKLTFIDLSTVITDWLRVNR